MQLKSKADPINVLFIKQNAGTSDSVSFSPQCQLTTHSNSTLTSTCSTGQSISGEGVSHLYNCNKSRTTNSGVTIVSQSTETEVTSAINGSIVSPAIAGGESVNVRISDLHSICEMSEMPRDDGKCNL